MPAKRGFFASAIEPRTAIRHTVPAIDRANAELQPVHIAFQLDLNLDVKRPSLLPDADS